MLGNILSINQSLLGKMNLGGWGPVSFSAGDRIARGLRARMLQRSANVGAPGLVNFITAVAYHFCPSLPAAFTQPGASTLADLCNALD